MIISNHRVLSVGFSNLFSGGFLLEQHIQAIIPFLKLPMVNNKRQGASHFTILYLGVPGITNAVNWYLTASTYTTQCFIFGALIGAHMAEAMFVKHLGFMKD